MKLGHALTALSPLMAMAMTSPYTGSLQAAEPGRASAAEAKKIFNQRCSACHNFGKGVKVGPDLKGVTTRRSQAWLVPFIRSSQMMIQRGDAVAVGLFTQFKQQRMPDWADLSESQILGLLDWFGANGPEQKDLDERDASLAKPAEVEMGSHLFTGRTRLANGGVACISCHTVTAGPMIAPLPLGGTLGPNLTHAYERYRDAALTLFLKHPCAPRAPETAVYLRPEESFALKAFLQQCGVGQRPTAGREPQ